MSVRLAARTAKDATVTEPSSRTTRVRGVVAAAAAAILMMGIAGTATAAEGSLPGDPLYGLNRTLEEWGFIDGGLDKRIEESDQLFERGDTDEAVEHLADSLEDEANQVEEEGDEELAEELRRAAEAVLSGGSENSLAVRTAVAEMLLWKATTDATGRDFGQGVAERARAIGKAGDDEVEGDDTVGDDTETTEPDDVEDTTDKPGRPDHAGPPQRDDSDKPGRPDHAGGNSKDKGKGKDKDKDRAGGPPENAGPPSHAGGRGR